ncbi:MAG: hypothetical protein KGH75_01165 [Rhodospirillales bacterium]|nr:hypothetical protein [Rhodospirillales bacterium]
MSTEATTAPGKPAAAAPQDSVAEVLAILREESREQLELLRTLVRLLLPKADDDGPKLEDLIAALVAQQRDILLAIRQVQSDVIALHEQREGVGGDSSETGHLNGNGAART